MQAPGIFGFRAPACQKTQKIDATGRKRVTRGTQEGFLSFSIRSFSNLLKGLKNLRRLAKRLFRQPAPGIFGFRALLASGAGAVPAFP